MKIEVLGVVDGKTEYTIPFEFNPKEWTVTEMEKNLFDPAISYITHEYFQDNLSDEIESAEHKLRDLVMF